ncbi:C-C motif chemokine 20-like [Sebastes umbrosus]|uniref:C-C motif chemokine 20-like n=1 Tax=Sebastes umbrosus TaxID=72105 RepID=UPI00189E4F89|nr:C-C motif chemokine 20-like [Sebastes umbrosus]
MAKLAVCVSILLVVLVALSDSSPICCTEYQDTPIPVKFMKHYRMQEVTANCNIKAVIIKTKKNRLFCADPERKWVKIAMQSIPEK